MHCYLAVWNLISKELKAIIKYGAKTFFLTARYTKTTRTHTKTPCLMFNPVYALSSLRQTGPGSSLPTSLTTIASEPH